MDPGITSHKPLFMAPRVPILLQAERRSERLAKGQQDGHRAQALVTAPG